MQTYWKKFLIILLLLCLPESLAYNIRNQFWTNFEQKLSSVIAELSNKQEKKNIYFKPQEFLAKWIKE